MDFKKSILEKKWFKLSETLKDEKEKGEIELVNHLTSSDFIDERSKIDENISDEEKRKIISDLVAKHLITGWKFFSYGDKDIPFSQKNAIEMMKNTSFRNIVYSILFEQKNFIGEIDLDLEFIKKK